jgi:predicted Rossmann fold nucleotide-binding protein DprA/Smf involved in DNA uptake
MTKVAIIGSRRRSKSSDKQAVIDLVGKLAPDDIVVSGGCAGPDFWAERSAITRGLRTEIYLPDRSTPVGSKWEAAKRYYDRNTLVAEAADVVYAFVAEDRKGGTEDTIRKALKMGKPIHLR